MTEAVLDDEHKDFDRRGSSLQGGVWERCEVKVLHEVHAAVWEVSYCSLAGLLVQSAVGAATQAETHGGYNGALKSRGA